MRRCYNDSSELGHLHICCGCESTSNDFDGPKRETADRDNDPDLEDEALGNDEGEICERENELCEAKQGEKLHIPKYCGKTTILPIYSAKVTISASIMYVCLLRKRLVSEPH
jgi:hypothetical protein